MITVGQLKESLAARPDDSPVVIFAINDSGRDWYASPRDQCLRYGPMRRVLQDDREELRGLYFPDEGTGYECEVASDPVEVTLIYVGPEK